MQDSASDSKMAKQVSQHGPYSTYGLLLSPQTPQWLCKVEIRETVACISISSIYLIEMLPISDSVSAAF